MNYNYQGCTTTFSGLCYHGSLTTLLSSPINDCLLGSHQKGKVGVMDSYGC